VTRAMDALALIGVVAGLGMWAAFHLGASVAALRAAAPYAGVLMAAGFLSGWARSLGRS
jgi:hypothetical protein